MANILVLPKFCRIEDEDDIDFLRALNTYLSFKYAGAEFHPLYKRHLWDGMERLLSKKLEFMTGLLDHVKDFFVSWKKEVKIIDMRKPFVPGQPIDLSPKLQEMKIVPYDYQLAAVEQAVQHDRVIFKHATGSGKSLTSALIAARLNQPTLIYVISKDLLHQFHALFSQLFDEEIGMIGDGICNIQRISIATIQTVGRALGMKRNEIMIEESESEKFDQSNAEKITKYLQEVHVHQIDECHCSASKTIKKIYRAINPLKIFGFSGTPHNRDDGADLLITAVLGNVVHEVSASELIKRGILAKPFIKFHYIKGHSHFTDKYQTVYNNHIVNNHQRNLLLMNETKKLLDKGYQCLVLFKTINHGKVLHELFESNGIDCEFLIGNDSSKKRDAVKKRLLARDSNCLIASTIYDIGIDVPTLSALVLAGSGKSSVKTLQRIGRVIRNGKEKPFAAVIEVLDDVRYLKKHSLVRKSIYEQEPEFTISFPTLPKK